MYPTLTFSPRSPGALAVVAVLLAAALLAGWLARRARGEQRGVALLFAAYLFAIFGALLFARTAVAGAPLRVSAYAVALVAGALAAWAILFPRLRSTGLPPRLVFYTLFGCLVFGVAGARLAHMLAELPRAASITGWIAQLPETRRGGLGVFGALGADTLFLVVLFRRFPEHSLARVLDAGASAIAINVAFGRVGCLLAGCCYGSETAVGAPWSIPVALFANDSPAGVAYAHAQVLEPGVRIWAAQPMEAAVALALAAGCEALHRRGRRAESAGAKVQRPGSIAMAGLGAYGLARAALETLRADSARDIAGVLTVWEALGLACCAVAVAWHLRGSAARHDGAPRPAS